MHIPTQLIILFPKTLHHAGLVEVSEVADHKHLKALANVSP